MFVQEIQGPIADGRLRPRMILKAKLKSPKNILTHVFGFSRYSRMQ